MHIEWLQRGLTAMRETLDVEPNLRKRMIEFLFDEGFWDRNSLTWSAARARFDACLNPGKKEFFKLAELWALMKHFERHQLFLAMAEDLGYQLPRRLATAERHQALLERIAKAMEASAAVGERALQDLEVLAAGEPQMSIDPRLLGPGGKFSIERLELPDADEADGSDPTAAPGGF